MRVMVSTTFIIAMVSAAMMNFPRNRLPVRTGRTSIFCEPLFACSMLYIMQAPQIAVRTLSIAIICQLASIRMRKGSPGRDVKLSGRTSMLTSGNVAARREPPRKAGKYPVRFNFFISRFRIMTGHLFSGCLHRSWQGRCPPDYPWGIRCHGRLLSVHPSFLRTAAARD